MPTFYAFFLVLLLACCCSYGYTSDDNDRLSKVEERAGLINLGVGSTTLRGFDRRTTNAAEERAGLIPLGIGTTIGNAVMKLGMDLFSSLPILGWVLGPVLFLLGGVLYGLLGLLLG